MKAPKSPAFLLIATTRQRSRIRFGVVCLSAFVAAAALLLARAPFAGARHSEAGAAPRGEQVRARPGEGVSVRAGGRGAPFVKLSDGRDVLTSFAGDAALVGSLERDEARPLSLASADFDEDGVADLASGYAGGGGIIALRRGNVDSIYTHLPEARDGESSGESDAAAFISPARVFGLSATPDFLGAGDFDADGHGDVAAASRGGKRIYLFPGDGRGGFNLPVEIALRGRVTAMVTGEINRPDGLTDVVVGIESDEGAKALVFEGPEGALRASPEVFPLPASVSSFALGRLGRDYAMDLAVAAGRDLLIVHGRDRKLSLSAARQTQVPPARVERRRFPEPIKSIATGNFKGDEESDIALLSEDGVVRLLSRARAESEGQRAARWNAETVSAARWPSATHLVRAHVSSLPLDDLIATDAAASRLHILTSDAASPEAAAASGVFDDNGSRREAATLDVEGGPVAVLPMQLNGDALGDLVVLRGGATSPSVLMSMPGAIITINSSADTNTRDGNLTLREAILLANGELLKSALTVSEQAQVNGTPAPGLDEIRFNIIVQAGGSNEKSLGASLADRRRAGGLLDPVAISLSYLMTAVYDVAAWAVNNEASIAPFVQACSYTVTPAQQNFTSRSGTGSLTVLAGAGCAWTATSNAAWITVTSGGSGSGNGAVGFSVTANTGVGRSGTLTVAGRTVTVTQAAVNEWITNGPFGGPISALAIDPSNTSTIYAATSDGAFSGKGVFKSTDGGGIWNEVNNGLNNLNVYALAIDPANPSTLYAGTLGGAVFKSTNGGGSWNLVANFPFAHVFALAIDPANPSTLYAGTGGSGVFKSTDGGGSWNPVNNGLNNANVNVLAVDPSNTNTIYAGTSTILFKSTDGGGNWSEANNGLTNSGINTLAVNPAFTNILYAGTGGSGVFKSTDGGGSWSAVNTGLTGLFVRTIVVDPSNSNTVYAGVLDGTFSPLGVFKSVNGGGSWSPVSSGLNNSDVYALAIDPFDTGTIYAGTFNGALRGSGVYKSVNGGGVWNPASSGLPTGSIPALAIDPANPNTIYAGAVNCGVFKSTNGGSIWIPISQVSAESQLTIQSLAIDPSNTNTIYAGTSSTNGLGLFKSTNGGSSWSLSNTGLNGSINALAIHPTNSTTLYAGGFGAFKSTNGGGNWSPINSGFPSQPIVLALAIDPANPNTLYAATQSDGVFKSVTGGGGWILVHPSAATALAIDPSDTNTVYANMGGQVNKSTNGGGSWEVVNSGIIGSVIALAVDPFNTGTVYAGTTGGFNSDDTAFKSTNGGNSWLPFATGLPDSFVRALAIDPTGAGTVYAGTDSGVFSVSPGPCIFGVSPISQSFSSSGGISGLTVTTSSNCSWSASSNDSWILISSETNVTGPGAVSYSVANNPSSFSRTGSMTVAGQTVTITQAGNAASCNVTNVNVGQTVNGALTGTDCFSPIRSTGGADVYFADRYSFSGLAGQQVSLDLSSAQFNTYLYLLRPGGIVIAQDEDGGGGTNSRIPAFNGTITLPVNGTYIIEVTSSVPNQSGNYSLSLQGATQPCTFSISPGSLSFASGGGNGSVTVTSPAGCNWTATSNDSFIQINSGTPGNGNGTVNYTVAANTGPARSGTITVAGQTHTISQAAGIAGCAYSISPKSQTFQANGGGGTVAVTAPVGCPWTATSNAGFIQISPGPPGSGNGTVLYTVAPNAGAARSGTLTVAGQTFVVVQGTNVNSLTITLLSPLPQIIDPVVIDGTTQPGYGGTPIIEINGAAVNSAAGLFVTAGSSTLRGLALNRFASNNRVSAILLITNGNNVVENCHVGPRVGGTSSFPAFGAGPLATGIRIRSSSNNRIGGTTPAARNLVAGIDGSGIVIQDGATANLVEGNYIGTDVTGSLGLGTQENGVYIQNASGNFIGDTTAGAGNLISGHLAYGVYLQDDSRNNLVQGNLVGTDSTGTYAIPNGNAGVFVYNPTGQGAATGDNSIGATTPAGRNVISGNDPYGVVLGEGATGTLVQGNYIGTSGSGAAALPNTYGVTATKATGSTIGGAVEAARNVISGNNLNGVSIGFLNNGQLGGTGTTVQGNYIGLNAAGAAGLGNGQGGVFVEVLSNANTIEGNQIAFNGQNGIFIPNVTANPGNPGLRISLLDNLIYANAQLGIDLGGPGVTPNDPLDADAGANLQQNFPVLTATGAAATGGVNETDKETARLASAINVSGTLNSAPNTAYTVHWYFSADQQCANNQPSSRPLAFGKVPGVLTDGGGNASFSFPFAFPPGIESGVMNCTATDPQGNTSEFSACFNVMDGPPAATLQFAAASFAAAEGSPSVTVTVTRTGPTAGESFVSYATSDAAATERKDYTAALGRLRFAPGETSKSFDVVITDDRFDDDGESFNVTLGNPVGGTLGSQSTSSVPIVDNDASSGPSPVKDNSLDVQFFVRQHYADFLGRAPDQAGLDFWTNRATNCGNPDLLVCRINVSAAFFLSIENQETGYLTHRAYRVAFGNLPGKPVPLTLREYLGGSRQIGDGVQVGVGNWQQQLESNKAAFFDEFVTTARFTSLYNGMSSAQYVDALNANAGGALSQAERDSLVNSTQTRAQILRAVAEDADFAQGAEKNRAFVLAQYFGYLRRNPDDVGFNGQPDPNFEGYNFWLGRLNQFGGNFIRAEMVKAFIQSIEYGERFGQ